MELSYKYKTLIQLKDNFTATAKLLMTYERAAGASDDHAERLSKEFSVALNNIDEALEVERAEMERIKETW